MKEENKINLSSKEIFENKYALVVSEDDRLRSKYILQMIKDSDPGANVAKNSKIPNVIIQFWDSKIIPSDVRECMSSWNSLEGKDFKYILFDNKLAKEFIANNFEIEALNAFNSCAHPAMKADYFRLCYLVINGGFYVDADDVYKGGNLKAFLNDDLLKLHPLCYNSSTNSMVETSNFIRNPDDLPELIFYVNNNPIIAPPGHPVLVKALKRSTQALLTQKSGERQDVQSMTGPGNLTASLVYHAIDIEDMELSRDFALLKNWDDLAESKWPLEYRSDNRNWRLWNGKE